MELRPLDSSPEDELELELALWLEHAKPGDSYVLRVLTEHYAEDILRFFLAILDTGENLSDNIQGAAALTRRVLYNAVGNLQNFQGQESVRNWLFHLTVSEFTSFTKNRHVIDLIGISKIGDKFSFNLTHDEISVTEEELKILSTFDNLLPEARIPVLLRYMFQISPAKISQILGVRIPAVHEHIKNFRMAVTEKLDERNQSIQSDDHHHEKFETWILLAIDGILEYDPVSQGKLDQHLNDCLECRSFRDSQTQFEKQISSAFVNRWPEVLFNELDVNKFVNSYQAPPIKTVPVISKIGLNQESVLFGLLLIVVIITGYFITRRESFYANPMVYPTLTSRLDSMNDRETLAVAEENKTEEFRPTPTLVEGSNFASLQSSDYDSSASDERRYIYYRAPTITADGRFVLFSTSFTTISTQAPDFKNALYLLDLVTGEIEALYQEEHENPWEIWNFASDVSDDGKFVVFQYALDKPVITDPNSCSWKTDPLSCIDVFLFNRETNTAVRIASLINEETLHGPNILPTISADGRWIAFWSAEKVSMPEGVSSCDADKESKLCWNVVILDRVLEEVMLLPIGRSTSNYAARDFERLSMSRDGERMALTIHKGDNLASDLNIENQTEVVIFDRPNSEFESLNTANNGVAGNGPSSHAVLSSNGHYAVYASQANNLVADDLNDKMDVFVRDITSGQTTIVSVSSEGDQANDASGAYFFTKDNWIDILGISEDARYVTFLSSSDNLVIDPPTNCPSNSWFPCTNVYVHDLKTSSTDLISTGSQRRDSVYHHPSISSSGRWTVYTKSDVDCYQAPVCSRIMLHDRNTGFTKPILEDQFVKLGDDPQGTKLTRLIDETMSGVTSLKYSPDGTLLASGSNDKSVRLWYVTNGEVYDIMDQHKQLVSDIDFSHNGNYLASASHDGVVNIWDIGNNNVETLTGPSRSITSLDFSPGGDHLAVGASNAAWVWDLTQQPRQLMNSQEHSGAQINSVRYSPEGAFIAQGSSDNTIWIINAEDGSTIARLGGHDGDILSLAFSPDGNYLASGSADAVVNVWRITQYPPGETGFENILSIQHADWINDLAFSPDSKLLAVASFGSEVQVWEIPSGIISDVVLGSRWDQALSIAFSPNGNEIAVGSSWGGIQLWNSAVP